jgi:hypothetical protein
MWMGLHPILSRAANGDDKHAAAASFLGFHKQSRQGTPPRDDSQRLLLA